MGPGDIYESSAASFLLPVACREMPFYVDGGSSFVDVRDIADAHVAALERGVGGITILGGYNLSIPAVARLVARIAGVRAPMRIPYALALGAAVALERAARWTRQPASIPLDFVRAGHLYTYVSSAKATRDLGYRLRPLEGSLAATFHFFLRKGRLRARTPELVILASKTPDSVQSSAPRRRGEEHVSEHSSQRDWSTHR
jgi:dihydroflavonol-4-reductase